MKETDLLQEVRMKASQLGAVMWRNNSGAYKTSAGHYIKYGVANPGGSDLIGIYKGKFTALEIKLPNKQPTVEQRNFLDTVTKNGGIAAVITHPDQLENILK
jgi:penicillin-binding protein-related factor A (putative recombinase)